MNNLNNLLPIVANFSMILKCERCKIQKYSISLALREIDVQRLKIGDICPKCWGVELNNKWQEFSKEKREKFENNEKNKPKFPNRTKCIKCGSVRLRFLKRPVEIKKEGTRLRSYNETSWNYVCKKCHYNSIGQISTNKPQ